FFFSSRRRHTRFSRDWSSDVCSSDLRKVTHAMLPRLTRIAEEMLGIKLTPPQLHMFRTYSEELQAWNEKVNLTAITEPEAIEVQIGRASCRERAETAAVAVALRKNQS